MKRFGHREKGLDPVIHWTMNYFDVVWAGPIGFWTKKLHWIHILFVLFCRPFYLCLHIFTLLYLAFYLVFYLKTNEPNFIYLLGCIDIKDIVKLAETTSSLKIDMKVLNNILHWLVAPTFLELQLSTQVFPDVNDSNSKWFFLNSTHFSTIKFLSNQKSSKSELESLKLKAIQPDTSSA